MLSLHNSIVLIGFKHVGKSVIAKALSEKIHIPFCDLDQQIESQYENTFNDTWNCRQIMQGRGKAFFRTLERNVLSQAVRTTPSILSLGGGAPLCLENQKMIKPFIVVHITAPKEIVLERIRASGQPAFFNVNEPFLDSFNTLWGDRHKIYEKIRDFSIENKGSVEEAVIALIEKLKVF